MVLLIPFFRELSYEFFLRSHQALALSFTIPLWWQLGSESAFNRICVIVACSLCGATSIVQMISIIHRNAVHRAGFPRARITTMERSLKIEITVDSRLNVKPGQYINIWIPAASAWSFLQSHPFVVASCEKGQQTTLTLLVQPRLGFTSRLLRCANHESFSDLAGPSRVLFSGPHGYHTPLGDFDRVLMVACGFGIVAQLPYLVQLIRGYSKFQIRTRRIHLVWQLQKLSKKRKGTPR